MTVATTNAPTAYRARPSCGIQERGHWNRVECRSMAVAELTVSVDALELIEMVEVTVGICAEHLRQLSSGKDLEA